MLLEVELCLLGCALLVLVLGLEGGSLVHWQLLNGRFNEALIQLTQLRLQDVEGGRGEFPNCCLSGLICLVFLLARKEKS
jgi:hypothetical protein